MYFAHDPVDKSPPKEGITRPPRGVLSFIRPESLMLYHFDETLVHKHSELSRRMCKRHRRRAARRGNLGVHSGQEESYQPPVSPPSIDEIEFTGYQNCENPFNVNASHFTLFFFGAPYCFHSLKFIPKLAKFIYEQNKQYESSSNSTQIQQIENVDAAHIETYASTFGSENKRVKQLQCIFIPDSLHQMSIQNLCRGTGIYFFKEPNDKGLSSVRSLFQVTYIPTVIVVNNETGKVVTDCARTAIEFNPTCAVQAWHSGNSGANIIVRFCTMS